MAPMAVSHAMLQDNALHSTARELKYARSSHLVELVTKDEDVRRLRFDVHVLEDDNDDLRNLLQQEEDRSDSFEKYVNENLSRAEAAEAQWRELSQELRASEKELQVLRAEAGALNETSKDTSAVISEKLELTRELSKLRPEIEHLRVQTANTEALLAEKLKLQRDLSNAQCDLEDAKRDTRKALAKRRNTGVEIAQEEQSHELRKELEKEKRARQRAERDLEGASQIGPADDVRKELAREKRARQKAEEALELAQENTQVEDVRKDLLEEKRKRKDVEEALEMAREELEKEKRKAVKAAKKADAVPLSNEQLEEIQTDLAKEKKARAEAEKALAKGAEQWTAEKAVLDDKLNQFRTKLKSTKESLKQAQANLGESQEAAPSATVAKTGSMAPPPKPLAAKKRTAQQMDSEATNLGTPGDGPALKRGRKQTAVVGDKSTFSITPFLNRTMTDAPDDRSDHEDDAASPVVARSARPMLAEKPASESNVQKLKPKQPRIPKAPALELITEEAESQAEKENGVAAAKPKEQSMKIKTKTTDGTEIKSKKPKPRKSLLEFENYNKEPEAERKQKKKAGRKLGGLGKTLFDEEDDAAAPASRGIFGSKGFGAGAFGGIGQVKGAGVFGGAKKGALMTTKDGSGFQFSPLKRRRQNLDDTLRG